MPYYNDYLAHYGVKGMKWGVRRKRPKSAPRTNWGKNRQYAKEQDRLNRELHKSGKQAWKSAKKSTSRGSAERNAAKRTWKDEKRRYGQYNAVRNLYTNSYGMSKAARGKQMQKLGITADTPYSNLSVGKTVMENGKAMAKQTGKYMLASVATSVAIAAGKAALSSYLGGQGSGSAAKALDTNLIELNPKQYTVS